MDLVDYLKVLRRRWRVIGATLAVALIAAWLTTPVQRPEQPVPVGTSYRATHTLLQAPDVVTPVNLDLTRLFATRGEIPRRAALRLGEPAERGPVLAAQVQVVADAKVGSLAVSVTGSDGPRAALVANAFAVETVENLRSTLQKDRDAELTETHNLVLSLGALITDLESRIAAEPANAALLKAQQNALLTNYSSAFGRWQSLTALGEARSPLITLEEAVPVPITASRPFTPPSSRGGRLALAGLVGLLLGVLLALVLERVDRSLRSREAVEDITSLPVVAEVPVLRRAARRNWSIQVITAPAGAVAEAYRSLRSAIMLVPSRPALQQPAPDVQWKTPQVLLVTSPLPSDGKTTTVANLAACLAESGRQVLVLDCDFRNPTAHRYLGVQSGRGISDLLAGTSAAELADVVRASAVAGVRVVTSGNVTDHPAALLARAGGLIDAARQLADVVLIDAAPVLSANDATDLVPYVDAVVLVMRSGRTTRDHALRTTELLARLSVPIAGTVLVASNGSTSRYSSGVADLLGRIGMRRRRPSSEPPRAWMTGRGQSIGRRKNRARHTSQHRQPEPVEVVAPNPINVLNGTGWPSRDDDGCGTRRVVGVATSPQPPVQRPEEGRPAATSLSIYLPDASLHQSDPVSPDDGPAHQTTLPEPEPGTADAADREES